MSGAARFSVLDVFEDSDDSVLSIDDGPVLSSPPTIVKPFKMQKIFPPPVNLNVQVVDSAKSTAPISGLLKLLESLSDDCAAPDSGDALVHSDLFFLRNSRNARSSRLHSNTRPPIFLLPSADGTLAQNSRNEPPSPPPPSLGTSTYPASSPAPSPSGPQNSDDCDSSEQSCLTSDQILSLMDTMKCYSCAVGWQLAVEAVSESRRLKEQIRCEVCFLYRLDPALYV
jgi:hypothetical protein